MISNPAPTSTYWQKLGVRQDFWRTLNAQQRKLLFWLEGRSLMRRLGLPSIVCGFSLEPLFRWIEGEDVDIVAFLREGEVVFHNALPVYERHPLCNVFQNTSEEHMKEVAMLGYTLFHLDWVTAQLQDEEDMQTPLSYDYLIYMAALVCDDPLKALQSEECENHSWLFKEVVKVFCPSFAADSTYKTWEVSHPTSSHVDLHPGVWSCTFVEDRYLRRFRALNITTYAAILFVRETVHLMLENKSCK